MNSKGRVLVATALLEAAAKSASCRPCCLPEIAAFAIGAKPALRLVLDMQDEAHFRGAALSANLELASTSIYLEPKGGSWFSLVKHPTGMQRTLVVIAKERLGASLLIDAESTNSAQAGDLLGYPACCVAAFERFSSEGVEWARALAASARDCRAIDARCNRYAAEWGGIGLLGELFPCSVECEFAMEYAENLYRATLELGLLQIAARAKEDSLRPIAFAEDGTVTVASADASGTLSFVWNT
jgi:hypothetical protein